MSIDSYIIPTLQQFYRHLLKIPLDSTPSVNKTMKYDFSSEINRVGFYQILLRILLEVSPRIPKEILMGIVPGAPSGIPSSEGTPRGSAGIRLHRCSSGIHFRRSLLLFSRCTTEIPLNDWPGPLGCSTEKGEATRGFNGISFSSSSWNYYSFFETPRYSTMSTN